MASRSFLEFHGHHGRRVDAVARGRGDLPALVPVTPVVGANRLNFNPPPSVDSLIGLRDALRDFAAARDWEQYHLPKNLAMALIVEAAELVEHFQWLTPQQSADLDGATRMAIGEEVADVLLYLIRLADVLEIDPIEAARRKMLKNAVKYPASK
ncbi:MAG: nucleotide pyrophosphohydrolase [Burkholderiales bacterium]|nr:nucleotide pyrophosphohydrolase [Burkholderiales bacterium]